MPIFNRITYSPVEKPEAYAVFDSSDGSFTFFRDDKGKYKNGQVSGKKTYYTGFEDITGNTIPSWLESDRSKPKNTIKTVTFKDKIQPKTCYRWFIGADSLTSITGLDKLDTANATNISRIFDNCTSLTSLDLSSFNTAKVTDMGRMFENCASLTSLDLSSFNTAKVTNMDGMFYGCKSLTSLNLSNFNTAAVADISDMFSGCNNLTSLDLSSLNTAKVTNMGYMFNNCSSLKTIYASSLFTTNAVSSSDNMFYNNTSLVGGAGTKYDANHKDKTYARIDGGTSNPGYFMAKQAYAVYDSTDQSMTFFRDDKGKYTDGQVSETKTYYTGFEDITGETAPSWAESWGTQKNTIKTVVFKDKIKPKTCWRWFSHALYLTSITGLDKLDTSRVTNMNHMFDSCSSLASLDVSSFNTKNVTNMGEMFYGCESLTSLDLSSFNTENVTNMESMFYCCSSLTSLDVSSFNTKNVTNMGEMFYNCSSLTSLDVSGFNTEKVTNMESMFYCCSSLTSLDVSSFNTAAVTTMREMFYRCESLTSLDLSSFNTENVTTMYYMFKECSSLTSLDLSSFNTENVTTMYYMFKYCRSLKTIYASSLFTTDAVSSSTDMFYNNTSLVGGAGTKYDSSHTDAAYARIDGGTSNPGYFTERDPRQAYAVYDSGDQSMTFFRDDKGKYTDGQVDGTKTYYTGFEDITGKTYPSWYDSDNYEQKNWIKTVAFKDKIQPKTCYGWFSTANSLTSITGLDKLDTANVTDMDGMFLYCIKLTSLNVSSFNTAAVTDMNHMFSGCSGLTSLDVSSFNTAKVTNMGGMFSGCTHLTDLDLSSFNTKNVTNMGGMFLGCTHLTSLDLSSFNTAAVTNMSTMFNNCSSLKTIYASSLFTTNAGLYSSQMFEESTLLTGGAGTKYDANHTDAAYARIDGGTSNPGYFTESFPKVVTWASGSDDEIAKMVEAADAGKINLGDYWKVGDTRKVNLAAMSATGVGESHAAQQVEMVLMNKGGKTLSNGKMCNFIVGLKDCLKENGYMNSSNTNAGSWRDSKRRAWCNETFRNAIPSALRGIFKQHTNTTGDQANQSTLIDTIDYFALPAEKEIFGDGYGYSGEGYSVNTEANSSKLTQFDWYKTSANRIKNVNGSANYWWERSPNSGYSSYFCGVRSNGAAGSYNASNSYGLAPFGCI